MARKKSKINSDNVLATALILIAVIILVIILSVYSKASSERDQIDKENFCAKDLKNITVVLIDHSDKLTAIQKSALETRLWDIFENLPKNSHQIQIFSVDQIKDNILTPELVICNPGTEKEMNRFTENQKIVHKQYEEKFKKHLDNILNNVLNKESASQSPIMEASQSVAVSVFISERNKHIKKKLILVSDLLEHTSSFSVYNGVINFDDYKTSNHWKAVKSDLNDVEIELYFLRREEESKLQDSKLRDFWMQFFENQGAKSTRFLPIEG